jgi:LysR family hydrogen peroxide-inducible transcriptional activator
MVAGGAGVTLLPELAVPTKSRRAEIAIRRFAKSAPHRTVAFVWRKRSALGTALRRLAGTMRSAHPGRSIRLFISSVRQGTNLPQVPDEQGLLLRNCPMPSRVTGGCFC